jgi:putative endonuclease
MSHLLRLGWRIEAHRFRLGHSDLDIIARKGSVVAFVEVKAWRARQFGPAVAAVGYRKRAVLARLAELWRVRFGRAGDQYRFDVISVEDGSRGSTSPQVTHIEGAWRHVDK